MSTTPKFNGTKEENFWVWMWQIENYYSYHHEDFAEDGSKITWMASQLGDRALRWYQDRREQREKDMLIDNWKAFKSAMVERFVDKHDARENVRKMRKTIYDGDIDDYLAKMQLPNSQADSRGTIWHEAIKDGLPEDIWTHMSYAGEEPTDTVEFFESVRRMGKLHEDKKRQTRFSKKSSSKPAAEASTANHSNPSASKRRRSGKESRKPVSAKDSKPTAPGATSSTWKDRKEWLKGVPDTLQKERHDKGLCTRCGRRDHKWYHCTGKIVVATASSTAAASERGKRKRKRKQEQDSNRDDGEMEEKPKVSAVGALVGRLPSKGGGRVYEIDSDEEMEI